MSASTLQDEKNQQIQAELDMKARRKALIGRFLPYVGLLFLFVFFVIVTKGKFLNEANRAHTRWDNGGLFKRNNFRSQQHSYGQRNYVQARRNTTSRSQCRP
jgi:hypothetical protein